MRLDSDEAAAVSHERGRAHPKVPQYLRIVNTLSSRIAAGVYAPGAQLPSGSQLCAEFGVSPMTARQALTTLENQGLVYAIKGRGTFVKSPDLDDPDFRLDSVEGDSLDESPAIRLLSTSMTRANKKIAKMLNISPGQRVVHLRRLVSKNGVPAMYHNEYILYHPRRPLVESQLQMTALDDLLESDRGHRFLGSELTISAIVLDDDGAKVLGREVGDLALSLEHVFHDSAGKPVSYGWFLLRADLFRLRSTRGTSRRVIGVETLGDD